MAATPDPGRLSQIQTLWSVVCKAHQGPETVQVQARRELLERYGGAAKRYLLGALRDADAADDLFQEFALRFCRGDFHRADPEKGRFRNFLKSSLFYLVLRHQRKQRGEPLLLAAEHGDPAAPDELRESELAFRQSWRDELLARAWASLQRAQVSTGRPYYDVLRHRIDHPRQRSERMAADLSSKLGKPITSAGVRQLLHRARDQFADLLLEEVTHSLDNDSPEELENELSELELLEYCRPALERRDKARSRSNED